ncbi:MAG: hypothetical protein FJ083_15220 [Cyanobacteria bacterium K_Offshore_surface_m2_239]|nr:hypothetical protein [Cyanobacteria bacterium K_Offshore_surface_m2_239]
MVTKVGHARPMLICTDCGLPVDQRQTSVMARQRLWGALTLVATFLISGSMLLLATIYDTRTAGSLEGSLDQAEERSGEEGRKEEEGRLLEPSGLVKLPVAVNAATPASTAQPETTSPQQQKQQAEASEGQP